MGQSTVPRLRLLEGGASNSRPRDKFVPTSRNHAGAGIDTVRLRVRDVDVSAREKLARQPHLVGARGDVYVQRDGCRWGSFPDGMHYLEGRVAAILDGPDAHYLATPIQLLEAAGRFADTVGVDVENVVTGRLDLASELRFENPREGLALMRAISSADVPWLKTGTEGSRRDGLETVAWRSVNGRSIQLRLYDKGRESGVAEPGTLLRGERQKRMRKGRELVASAIPTVNLRKLYVGRELASFVAQERELTVCNSIDAAELLDALAAAGEIKRQGADLLMGFVMGRRRQADYTNARGDSKTWDRRWRKLRELGIALDDQAAEKLTVPVSRYLGQLADAWAVAA
jgi:hypothetical protein